MDRDKLQAHLEAGRSLKQIGELEGKHPSTVGYWVTRHGLEANGRAKYSPNGKLDPETLRALIGSGLTARAIAAETGVSHSAVRHWLARLGLKTHRMAGIDRFTEAREAGLRELVAECKVHGMSRHVRRSDDVFRCARCSSASVVKRRRRVKQILVDEAGGSCSICGYDRCLAALQFHHLDPSEKRFVVSLRGVTRGIEELRREAAKCALLCANCHAEVERGLARVPPR